jgi:hypothetical protein
MSDYAGAEPALEEVEHLMRQLSNPPPEVWRVAKEQRLTIEAIAPIVAARRL